MNFISSFMRNRYGKDALSICMLVLALVLAILARVFGFWVFALIATLLVVVALFRVFSTNIPARHKENQKLVWFTMKVKKTWHSLTAPLRKFMFRITDNEHNYYRCKNCKQEVRVPTGKGKILITCPKCKTQFTKKT